MGALRSCQRWCSRSPIWLAWCHASSRRAGGRRGRARLCVPIESSSLRQRRVGSQVFAWPHAFDAAPGCCAVSTKKRSCAECGAHHAHPASPPTCMHPPSYSSWVWSMHASPVWSWGIQGRSEAIGLGFAVAFSMERYGSGKNGRAVDRCQHMPIFCAQRAMIL